MNVTQISPILNAVFGELLGGATIPNPNYNPEATEDASNPKEIANPNLFDANLSNIVDVGYRITSSSEWGNNFDKYVGKIIDKVGRTIFRDRVYKGSTLGLRREAWDYASVLEKIRVEVGDFLPNDKWRMMGTRTEGGNTVNYGSKLPDGTSLAAKTDYSKIFDFDEPAEVDALYFNLKDTFRLKICMPRDQMEGAFKSAAAMERFFGMIRNRIETKMEVALEALDQAAETNFIGAKLALNSNVVDLKADFIASKANNTDYSGYTAQQMLEDADFLRYCVRRIKTDKKLLAKFSGKYNKDNYGTFTPDDKLKVFALTDFATAMETVLKSNTYHDNFVALDGYVEVPYWQASGSDSFESRSSIYADVVTGMSKLGVPNADDIKSVDASGIVFVMQDVDAVMTGSEQMDVDSLYNPEGRFYKYWYGHDVSYYNDLSENGIVYVIGTGKAPVGAMDGTLTLAAATGSGASGKTVPTVSITGATSYKGAVTDAPLEIGVGVAAPSTVSTSITSGETALAATAGQYINIVGIKSSKVVGVVQKQIAASEIAT